jgi:putative hydrolase of the HAD superfamily
MQIDLIALDADDTLWHNEIHYRRGREIFNTIMQKYGIPEPDEMRVNEVEISNLEFYGYGAVGFAVSLVEAAVELTEGQIGSGDLLQLLSVSKDILSAEVELYDGVEETVHSLAETHKLMLITKGDGDHQSSKVERSGLKPLFDHIEVVAEKSAEIYASILAKYRIPAQRFIMVGNAMKSDVLPVLEIGGSAVYIHNDLTWSYENVRVDELPEERFFEIDGFGELPALIKRIEG